MQSRNTLVASDSRLRGVILPSGFPSMPEHWECRYELLTRKKSTQKLFSVWQINKKREKQRLETSTLTPRILLLVHGLSEHCGRYFHFPYYLDAEVDWICALDLRGHGRSEGLRGHVHRFEDYLDDVEVLISRAAERASQGAWKAPHLHLFGHSMGGLIALRYLFLRDSSPLKAVSISAPLLGLRLAVPAAKKTAAYFLSGIWGSLQLNSGLDPRLLSTDLNVGQAYAADRLVHHKATPRLFTELQAAMQDTVLRTRGIRIPIQFLIPMQDQIVNSEITLEFVKKLQCTEKDLVTYPDFRHESFNEKHKEQAFEDLIRWIKVH